MMAEHNKSLTRNQALVLNTLTASSAPMSAYAILDDLRSEGLKAPLQIYRALDALISDGLAHRLESLNAFVACTHDACSEHKTVAFMICQVCNLVTEINDQTLTQDLSRIAQNANFVLKGTTIELRGKCSNCAERS